MAKSKKKKLPWLKRPAEFVISPAVFANAGLEDVVITNEQYMRRLLTLWGFEIVDDNIHYTDGTVDVLCRRKVDEDILFNRILLILSSVDAGVVEVYKKYVVKSGQLVFGWFLVLDMTKQSQIQLSVVEAFNTYKKLVDHVPLGNGKPINPLGRFRGQDGSVGPGQGYGVQPMRPIR